MLKFRWQWVGHCITLCLCVQWVPEITHHCPKTPFLLVGTQIDLRDDPSTIEKLAKNKQKPITPETAEKLARDLKAVKYVECSALTQVIQVSFIYTRRTLLNTRFTPPWQELRKWRKDVHSHIPPGPCPQCLMSFVLHAGLVWVTVSTLTSSVALLIINHSDSVSWSQRALTSSVTHWWRKQFGFMQ